MAYDVARIRSWFPSLEQRVGALRRPGRHADAAAVGDAVASVLTGPLSNRGTIGESEERAEEAVHGFRLAMADLLDGHPRGIVHGRSATQLIYDFSRHLSRDWGARRRGRGDPPRPRLERAALGAGRRARRRHRALGRLRPRDRRARRPTPSRRRSPVAPGSSP